MAKQKIDDLAVVLSASSDQLAGDLRAAAKLLDGFKKQIDKQDVGGAALRQTSRELQSQKKAAAEASAAWRAVARAKDMSFRNAVVGGAVGGLTAAGGMLAAKGVAAATSGVFDQLRQSVDLAAELEQTSIAFEVMTGSAKKGAQTIASLRALAVETPFSSADVIGSAKQLLGFGFDPAQAVATIRMLGDVSAGTGKDLKELSYLYGTLAAQGRAYMTDINQFATAGVPIFDTLAKVLKVNKSEVRGLVEEGKVGANEVLAAFKLMTGPGGLYANLTARKADTMKGAREQLGDAVDMLKTRLGQVIIEQMGLKQGARDTESFVKRVEEGLPRIERFVKFVGSLGRSLATVASQFLQAAAEAARFSDQLLSDSFPEMRKALREFADWVESGKEFRIRPEFVLEGVIAAGRGVMTFFRDFLQGLKDVGETMRDYILTPIRKAFVSMLQTWAEAKDLVRDDVPADQLYSPPAFFERDDRIVKRFRKLWEEQVKLTGEEAQARELDLASRNERFLPNEPPPLTPDEIGPMQAKVRARVKELDAARLEFLKAFDLAPNDAQTKLYIEGVVPSMPSRGDNVFGAGGGLQRRITGTESALQRWDALGERMKADLAVKRSAEDAANAITALGGGALFAGKALAKIDAERAATTAGAGGLAMVGRDLAGAKLLPREELKPFDLAPAGERVDRVQLPDAALRDTEAAVRIINLNMAQNDGQKQPLNAIEKNTAATVQGIMDLLRKLQIPEIIRMPY